MSFYDIRKLSIEIGMNASNPDIIMEASCLVTCIYYGKVMIYHRWRYMNGDAQNIVAAKTTARKYTPRSL